MHIWGTIAGGILGYLIIGWPGILLGGAIGYIFDKRRSRVKQSHELREGLYIEAIFSVLGYVAKADGRVSPQEIYYAERAMQSMELNPQQKEMAVRYFRRGKSPDFDFEGVMQKFAKKLGRNTNLKRIFLGIQLEAALADGHLGKEEERVIYRIADILGIQRQVVEIILSRYQVGEQGQRAPETAATDQDYELLGLTRNAKLNDVKRAYRRKISQYHPDKLVAKGLPDEMMKYANSMSEKLNSAYRRIKQDLKNA